MNLHDYQHRAVAHLHGTGEPGAALFLDMGLRPNTGKQNNHPHNLIVFPGQSAHARHHKLNHCGLAECDCGGIRLKEVMPR